MPDTAPPRRWLAVLVGVLVLIPVGAVAVWAYQQRVEAERTELRARQDALADEDRAWERRRLARLRADREAEIAALPARLADALPAGPRPTTAELQARIVGAWHGDGRTVEYRADGTFRDAATGREWAGNWAVEKLTGSRVLHVRRTGGGPAVVRMTVEGDELIHDDEPGRAAVLRRR